MKILPFDTETTGIPDWHNPSEAPHQPHLVEIAAILAEGGEEIDRFHTIVRPDGWTIPADVAAIHGITQERAMDEGIPEADAIEGFLALHRRGDMRVAHNESFDARILRIAIKRFAGATQEERDAVADAFKAAPRYCTCNAAKPIMQLPPTEKMKANARFRNSYKPPTLGEAHEFFLGEPLEDAHSALADALGCWRVYEKLQERAGVV